MVSKRRYFPVPIQLETSSTFLWLKSKITISEFHFVHGLQWYTSESLTCCISLIPNQTLALVGCNSHLSQQQILGILCPFHHFANLSSCSTCDNPEILPVQVKIWNDPGTLCIAPPNQVVPYIISFCLGFFSSRALKLLTIYRPMQTLCKQSTPYTVLLFSTTLQSTITM